ncbi:MAG: metallophosphoesterase [Phycisphaerae bacterium]
MVPGIHTTGGRAHRGSGLILCGALIVAPPALGQEGATRDDDRGALLLAPTQGRPAVVLPGGAVELCVCVASAPERVRVELHDRRWGTRLELALSETAAADVAACRPLRLAIPPDASTGAYDVEVRIDEQTIRARHAVAVVAPGARTRVVHLGAMHLGEVGAPEFEFGLIRELNLLAPTLIIMTGSYVDPTHDDPPDGWRRMMDALAQIDAPVVMACGEHDDPRLYSELVAPSPVGVVETPGLRVVVLYDHTGRPLSGDPGQRRWIESVFAATPADTLTVVVGHAALPSLLGEWHTGGVLSARVREARLGLWFTSAPRRGDEVRRLELAAAAAPMLLASAAVASRSMRDGSDGVARFRVVEIDGARVASPGTSTESEPLGVLLAVGRLTVHAERSADDPPTRAAVQVVNHHPFALRDLRVPMRVRAAGDARPWVRGGRLERAERRGDEWDCSVRFDLPDKGALRIVAGTEPAPEPADLRVAFELPGSWSARADGALVGAAESRACLRVTNASAAAAQVAPLVRLDGSLVPYRLEGADGPVATAYRLRLEPGESVTLQPDWSAVTVAPGRRMLQVYLKGSPDWTVVSQALAIAPAP